jgi:type IV secretion system protein VirB4
VLPAHRNAIHAAMTLLRANPEDMRSLSDLYHIIQDVQVKEAIKHYTQEGAMGHLLDASKDNLDVAGFTVFEIEKLMELGDKNLIPVLLYIFHRIEKALKGQPGLLILDEAWIALGHAVFREKIREWLKVLRKACCAVVLATQSLSDAVRSGIFDVLVESCPTQILLPNPKARQEGISDLYRGMGLNSRQIDIVAAAMPKREYYVTSPEGRRLISLALGPVALAFVGASDKESIARIKELEQQYGQEWPEEWLRERGATQ